MIQTARILVVDRGFAELNTFLAGAAAQHLAFQPPQAPAQSVSQFRFLQHDRWNRETLQMRRYRVCSRGNPSTTTYLARTRSIGSGNPFAVSTTRWYSVCYR